MLALDGIERPTLKEAAVLLVDRIGAAVIFGADELAPESTTDQTHRMAVRWEWVALLLHLTNRWASAILGEPRRAELFHLVGVPIINSIVDTFLDGSDEDKSAYTDDVVEKLIIPRQREYAECKPDLVAPPGQSQGGTILWEFGERVADAAGGDPRITFKTVPMALEALKRLEIPWILELCC